MHKGTLTVAYAGLAASEVVRWLGASPAAPAAAAGYAWPRRGGVMYDARAASSAAAERAGVRLFMACR